MKEFILNLDKPRRLVYDFDAWDLIAEKYTSETEDFDLAGIKVKEIPFLTFAGLRWEDPELTEQKTKELLNEGIRQGKTTIVEITEKISAALSSQSGVGKLQGDLEAGKKTAGPAAMIPGSRKKRK